MSDHRIDTAIGSGLASAGAAAYVAPTWVAWITTYGNLALVIGGLALLGYRFYLAKKGKSG